jgi:hypothetical protein
VLANAFAFGRKMKSLQRASHGLLMYLAKGLKQFSQCYVCIEGPDECDDAHRRSVLESLKTLARDLGCSAKLLKLFLTGRLHVADDVKCYLLAKSEFAYLLVTLEASPNDIRKYVIDAIEKDTSKLSTDLKFKDEIVHEIVESSNGMLVS